MPRRAVRAEHSIDWLGAGLLSAGTAALLLGLVWGGRDYAWSSGHVLVAFAVSAVVLFAVRARRAAHGRADPAVRAAAQPDRRRQRRVHGTRRDGDVRHGRLRAALRAGRDRHDRDLVGRRADAADARRRRHLAPHRAAHLAHRALPLERRHRPARARARDGAPLADGRAHDDPRGGARHGRSPGSGSAR